MLPIDEASPPDATRSPIEGSPYVAEGCVGAAMPRKGAPLLAMPQAGKPTANEAGPTREARLAPAALLATAGRAMHGTSDWKAVTTGGSGCWGDTTGGPAEQRA